MFDADMVTRAIALEEPTERELGDAGALAPGDYEIYSENLNVILQEGKEVMTRMGISSMGHSGDTLVAIYTAAGDLVSAVLGTYLHSVTGQVPIKFIIDRFRDDPSVGVCEGDIYYCNEALDGAVRNADQLAIMPIFVDGELLAWVVSGAHPSQTGGNELTPIKIGERYQLKNDLLLMMENLISRAPRMQVTDVRARVAACDRVRVRLQGLAGRRGTALVRGLLRRMIQQTSAGVSRRIESWPDGTYRHNVFMDTTGHEDGLLRASVALTVRGDRITIGFAGTSPEHEGSHNAFANVIRGHCAVALYQFPFHDLPISSGLFEHIDIEVPHGTFLDADPEAAISCSPLVGALTFPLLGVALSKAMFPTEQRDLVCGFTSSSASAVMVAGTNQHGVRVTDFIRYPLNAYGLAARHDRDGIDVWGSPHRPWGRARDVEDIEAEFPLLHLYQKQQRDTCGYGRFRGGVGAAVGYVVYRTSQLAFTTSQKESLFPAHNGLFGGYSMTVVPGIRVVGADLLELMAAGEGDLPTDDRELAAGTTALGGEVILEHQTRGIRVVAEGDVIAAGTQGSGGYGDVLERDPEAVVADLRAELISDWTAREVFAVAYDPETLLVDADATDLLRGEHRRRRLANARPFGEFIAQWEQRRPPEAVLKHFGEWPSGEPNRTVVRS